MDETEKKGQDAGTSGRVTTEREPIPSSSNNKESASSGTRGSFDCNICLDQAKDAVVSKCGHLFCWPCLHQWLITRRSKANCPVCKAAISKESVIPLYGHGGDNQKDPRSKVPPRPPGQRTEPEPNSRSAFGGLGSLFSPAGGGGNFQMSVGFGAFPFGLLSTSFNIGSPNQAEVGDTPDDSMTRNESEILSKFFLFLAVFFIFWILFF